MSDPHEVKEAARWTTAATMSPGCATHIDDGTRANTDLITFRNGRIVEFCDYYDTAMVLAAASA